jgi:hypothetical protein
MTTEIFYLNIFNMSISFKIYYSKLVCSHLNAEIAVSNPTEGMGLRLLCFLCVV